MTSNVILKLPLDLRDNSSGNIQTTMNDIIYCIVNNAGFVSIINPLKGQPLPYYELIELDFLLICTMPNLVFRIYFRVIYNLFKLIN